MPQTAFIAHARTADGWTAPVTVTRKRVRNLNLRVHADGSVSLSIPWCTSAAAAQEFLDCKSGWIRKRVERRAAQAEMPLVPLTGPDAGTLPLWGTLVDAADALEMQAGNAGANIANLANIANDELRSRIDALYRREVVQALPSTVARVEAVMDVHATRWSVRCMKTRWGSCTPKTGTIRISSTLAAYQPACLDYVAAHELTHLLEPSHNARFHALLDRFCPTNRELAAILKRPAREVCQR